MKRVAWIVFLGMLLSACGVYRVENASIEHVDLELMPEASAVKVVAHGVLANGCTRVGEVKQRRESKTFFVTIKTIYEQPAHTACTLAISEFREEVLLNVQGLAGGTYTVDVNGVRETFELPGEGVFVEGGGASLSGVDAQVLASSTEASGIKVGVFIEGELADPCVELRDVKQTRKGNTFKLDLETWTRTDFSCPPVTEFFWDFALLEPQFSSGTYQVEVVASNTLTTSFELYPDATYREAKVTGLEVVPVPESFTVNVTVRGELQGSCEVIDGAVQRQEGTDRDTLPDSEFVISLISRTTGMCGNETVPFEEVILISSYGSGDYTVNVNGVVENFTLPGAELSHFPKRLHNRVHVV